MTNPVDESDWIPRLVYREALQEIKQLRAADKQLVEHFNKLALREAILDKLLREVLDQWLEPFNANTSLVESRRLDMMQRIRQHLAPESETS